MKGFPPWGLVYDKENKCLVIFYFNLRSIAIEAEILDLQGNE